MKKKKGFTLIELIATMAILSIFTIGIQAVVRTDSKIYNNRNAQLDLQFDAKKVMYQITTDIQKTKDDKITADKYIEVYKLNGTYTYDSDKTTKFYAKIINNILIDPTKPFSSSGYTYEPVLYIEGHDDNECFYATRKKSGIKDALVKIAVERTKEYEYNASDNKELTSMVATGDIDYKNLFVNSQKKDIITSKLNLAGFDSTNIILGFYPDGNDYYMIYKRTDDKIFSSKLKEKVSTGYFTSEQETVAVKNLDSIDIKQIGDSYQVAISLKDAKGYTKALTSSEVRINYGGDKR